ncbi:Uma2 family endonuclease [Actinoplanes sp. NPDC051343]|uniref:Uma2 family endonuclease n=1 Tax=Actinoplanes sp. NPDC051343 TaxID=3363906 RepID=UPI0037960B50
MSELHRDHPGPWTEAEFLALGPTPERIELIDGSLRVSPAPNRPHQDISFLLMVAVRHAARAAGFRSWEAINVRLSPRIIVIPDLVVGTMDYLGSVAHAADVAMVGEILSPSNEANDRVEKLRDYAAAGIPWYLLVEPDMTNYRSITLRLYRLDGESYVEQAVAAHGEILKSDAPFPFAIDTVALIDF